MSKDYYGILGVPRNASADDIKKSYRKLAMQFHPDRNPGKEDWANEKFKEINEAFAVLGDPDKRRQYDQFGTAGNPNDIFGSANTRGAFEEMMRDMGSQGLGFDFLDRIFGDFLGRRGGNFSFRVFQGRPGNGINLEDLMRQQATAQSRDIRYEIAITHEQAEKGMEKTLTRNGKRLMVKIPAGIRDGMTIRLRNARQTTDGMPGDILIIVKVK